MGCSPPSSLSLSRGGALQQLFPAAEDKRVDALQSTEEEAEADEEVEEELLLIDLDMQGRWSSGWTHTTLAGAIARANHQEDAAQQRQRVRTTDSRGVPLNDGGDDDGGGGGGRGDDLTQPPSFMMDSEAVSQPPPTLPVLHAEEVWLHCAQYLARVERQRRWERPPPIKTGETDDDSLLSGTTSETSCVWTDLVADMFVIGRPGSHAPAPIQTSKGE